jgi:hypothetical protein
MELTLASLKSEVLPADRNPVTALMTMTGKSMKVRRLA